MNLNINFLLKLVGRDRHGSFLCSLLTGGLPHPEWWNLSASHCSTADGSTLLFFACHQVPKIPLKL